MERGTRQPWGSRGGAGETGAPGSLLGAVLLRPIREGWVPGSCKEVRELQEAGAHRVN